MIFSNWLDQNRFSDQESQFYQILWFSNFHEAGAIIHPTMIDYIYGKNVLDFAAVNFDIIENKLNLLNDPKIFHKELNGRKFTREEIKDAYSRMRDFAQSLN